jgi:hypothetical protein
MRCTPWVAALLTAGAASASHQDGDEGILGCGMLAPFGTSCQDCCLPASGSPSLDARLLGFTGVLHVRLEGSAGAWAWRCEAWAMDRVMVAPGVWTPSLETCVGPWVEGAAPAAGEGVQARCRVASFDGFVGPWGPWGCRITP